MSLIGIPISPDECIGDSLVTINNAFIELDNRTLTGGSGGTFAGVTTATTLTADNLFFFFSSSCNDI